MSKPFLFYFSSSNSMVTLRQKLAILTYFLLLLLILSYSYWVAVDVNLFLGLAIALTFIVGSIVVILLQVRQL
jgi:hypothetical protein